METTQHTPADVRERVKGAWATVEAAALAQANVLDSHYGGQPAKAAEIRNAVEQVAALLRTPRGEGEAEPVAWRVEYRRRGDGDARWYHLSTYTSEMDARERARHAEGAMRVLECRVIPLYASPAAALRSEAQGEDRWEDVVFGPITEAYNEAHAARRGEAPGDGPVGAVCANCGAPNAAIAGGELDPDEAVCSSECYDQLKELGCPQEHGDTYRPKPARTNGGNDATT